MAEQYEEFIRAGAEVVGIVNDSVENARVYWERHNLPFPVLADSEHRLYDRYQVESKALSLGQRPGLFVIDREGTLRYACIGWQQWEIPRNAEVLEVCRRIPCGAGDCAK